MPVIRELAALLCAVGFVTNCCAADWPQWRGPSRDGVSLETGLIQTWGDRGPPKLWDEPIGEGFSGVSVVGNRAYTLAGQGNDTFVLCLAVEDGDEIWRRRIDRKFTEGHGNGPRSTPVVAEGRVFALSAWGALVALNAEDGSVIWSHALREVFSGRKEAVEPWRGYATSPLVDDDLLLVEVGGPRNASYVAFYVENGETAWSSGALRPAYSSPVIVEAAGARQALFLGGQALVSLEPRAGDEIWRFAWETSYDQNVGTPVFIPPDMAFISEGYDGKGAVALRIIKRDGKPSIEEAWRNDTMRNDFASSVYTDGFLYGFDGSSLKCLDATDGRERWKERGFGRGTLIAADGRLIVLGERGQLALADATPDRYRERARMDKAISGKCWTAPSLANGRLYLRNEKRIACYDFRNME